MPIKVDRIGTSVGMESALWEGLKERSLEIFDDVIRARAPVSRMLLDPLASSGGSSFLKMSLPSGGGSAWYMGPGGLVSCYAPRQMSGGSVNLPLLPMASPKFDIRKPKDVEVAAGVLLQSQDANLVAMLDYARLISDVDGDEIIRFVIEDTDDDGLWKDLNELLSTPELSATWAIVCHPDVARGLKSRAPHRVGDNLETSIGIVRLMETRLVPQVIADRRVSTLHLVKDGRPGSIGLMSVQLAFFDEDEAGGAFFVQRSGFAISHGFRLCVIDAYPKEV